MHFTMIGGELAIVRAREKAEKALGGEWSWWDQQHRTRRDWGNGAFGESDIEGKAAVGKRRVSWVANEFQSRG
jgi:hypothetical protein